MYNEKKTENTPCTYFRYRTTVSVFSNSQTQFLV